MAALGWILNLGFAGGAAEVPVVEVVVVEAERPASGARGYIPRNRKLRNATYFSVGKTRKKFVLPPNLAIVANPSDPDAIRDLAAIKAATDAEQTTLHNAIKAAATPIGISLAAKLIDDARQQAELASQQAAMPMIVYLPKRTEVPEDWIDVDETLLLLLAVA